MFDVSDSVLSLSKLARHPGIEGTGCKWSLGPSRQRAHGFTLREMGIRTAGQAPKSKSQLEQAGDATETLYLLFTALRRVYLFFTLSLPQFSPARALKRYQTDVVKPMTLSRDTGPWTDCYRDWPDSVDTRTRWMDSMDAEDSQDSELMVERYTKLITEAREIRRILSEGEVIERAVTGAGQNPSDARFRRELR